MKALEQRDWSDSTPQLKVEFEAGVRFGTGIFNVVVSLIPPKMLRMAEMVGWSGDRVITLLYSQ